ncbi:hypothetical protein BCR22_04420 [Enterococcus plantarum]|uniref:hypothetical protein n=1 Tax=Enterococcus plantarum TaxID=1077675 RepID=UPI00084DAAC4|nr:hypothetical protein [Enterococcus plantarum]OEG12623.1 hypothetical protein BCR22_04420 [Enterococcus plantarum]
MKHHSNKNLFTRFFFISKKIKMTYLMVILALSLASICFFKSSVVFSEETVKQSSTQVSESQKSSNSEKELDTKKTSSSTTSASTQDSKESAKKITAPDKEKKGVDNPTSSITPFGIYAGHYYDYIPDLYKYNGVSITRPSGFEGEWPPYNSIYTGEYGTDYFTGKLGDLGNDWQYQYVQIAGIGPKTLNSYSEFKMYRTMPYQVDMYTSKYLGYRPAGFLYRQKLDLNKKQVMGFYYRSSVDGPGFTATLHNDTNFKPSTGNELSDPLVESMFGPIGGGGFGLGAYPLTYIEKSYANSVSGSSNTSTWGLSGWNLDNLSAKKYETDYIENAVSIELDFNGGQNPEASLNGPLGSAYNQYIYSEAPSRLSGHMAMIKPEQFKSGIITNVEPQSNAYHNYFSAADGTPVGPVWDKVIPTKSEGLLKGGRAWRYMEVTWDPFKNQTNPSAPVTEGDLSATVYALDSDFNRSGINPQLGAASGISTIKYLNVDRSPKGVIARFEKPARINIQQEFKTSDNTVYFEVTSSTGVAGYGKGGSVDQNLLPTIIPGRGTNNLNDEPKTNVKKTAAPDKIVYKEDTPPSDLSQKTSKFSIEFENDASDNKKITQFNITDDLSKIADKPFEYIPYDSNNKSSGTTINIMNASGNVKSGFPISGQQADNFWKSSVSTSKLDQFEWPSYQGGQKGFPYPLNPGDKVMIEFYAKSVYTFKTEDGNQVIKKNEAQIDFDTDYEGINATGNTKLTDADVTLLKETQTDAHLFLRQVMRTDETSVKPILVKPTLPIPTPGYARITANNSYNFSMPIVSYNYNITGVTFGGQYGLPSSFTEVIVPSKVAGNVLSMKDVSIRAVEQPMYYRYVGMKIEDQLPVPQGVTNENQSILPDITNTTWTGDITKTKYVTFIYEPVNKTSLDFEKPFSGSLKFNQIGKVN